MIYRIHNKNTDQRFSITPYLSNFRIDSLGVVYRLKYAQDNMVIWNVAEDLQVEWGMVTIDKNGKRLHIYQGDWYVDWNTGVQGKCGERQKFYINNSEQLLPEMFPMIEIVAQDVSYDESYEQLRQRMCT